MGDITYVYRNMDNDHPQTESSKEISAAGENSLSFVTKMISKSSWSD
jgi:hypothetical protein